MLELKEIRQKVQLVKEEISKVIYGKEKEVELLLVALLSEGHVLLDDVPGVGKTTLVKAFAKTLGLKFNRVQGTPDLIPSDITGSSILDKATGDLKFKPGPIFTNLLLFDEINRVTPKTQAALLEAMEERQVTVEGVTYQLPTPFMVIATQNPLEFVGIYPLVESQLDRFLLRMRIGYPDEEAEIKVILTYSRKGLEDPLSEVGEVLKLEDVIKLQELSQRVRISDKVARYISGIVRASRERGDLTLPLSPRGGIALARASASLALLRGRDYVIPDDVKELALPVLSHRIFRGASYDPEGNERIIEDILKGVEVPI